MDLLTLLRILVRRWMIFIPDARIDRRLRVCVVVVGQARLRSHCGRSPHRHRQPVGDRSRTIHSRTCVRSTSLPRPSRSSCRTSQFDRTCPIRDSTPTTRSPSKRTPRSSHFGTNQRSLIRHRQPRCTRRSAPDVLGGSADGTSVHHLRRFITAQTISSSPGARPIHAARDRTLFGVLALGLAASVAAAVSIDQLLAQRSGPRSHNSQGQAQPAADGTNPWGLDSTAGRLWRPRPSTQSQAMAATTSSRRARFVVAITVARRGEPNPYHTRTPNRDHGRRSIDPIASNEAVPTDTSRCRHVGVRRRGGATHLAAAAGRRLLRC